MILEQAFPQFLLTVPAITELVRDQVYGIIRPQGPRPLPEILISRTQTTRQDKFCGVDPLVNADMQLDCYSDGLQSATTLARAVRRSLKNFSGMMGDVVVQKVFLTNEFPVYDPDPGIIRVTQTYNFWYVEDDDNDD
jgi:Protein of unknown function (DUF3168)